MPHRRASFTAYIHTLQNSNRFENAILSTSRTWEARAKPPRISTVIVAAVPHKISSLKVIDTLCYYDTGA